MATSFTLSVGGSPQSVITSVLCSFVDIKQFQNGDGPASSFYVTDRGQQIFVPAGGTYRWSKADDFAAGTVVGTIQIASSPANPLLFTVTQDLNGGSVPAPPATGGGTTYNFADAEIPSGTGTSYSLAHTPNPAGSLSLYRNGVIQKGGGLDFTLSGNSITSVLDWTGDSLLAFYRF